MATDSTMIAALAGARHPLFAVPQETLRQMAGPWALRTKAQQIDLEADPFMQWNPSREQFNERFTGQPAPPIPSPTYDFPYGAASRDMPESILRPYRGTLTPGELMVPPGVSVPDQRWGVGVGRDVRAD